MQKGNYSHFKNYQVRNFVGIKDNHFSAFWTYLFLLLLSWIKTECSAAHYGTVSKAHVHFTFTGFFTCFRANVICKQDLHNKKLCHFGAQS